MSNFLYYGRLEKEKGIDTIIDMISLFPKNTPFKLFIFGSGSYESEIRKLSNANPNIHFFWRQDLDTIARYAKQCDYCLAPSKCLESFGLIALTALKRWLPTIGYAKWGLKEFIDPTLDLTHTKWTTPAEKLYHLIKSLSENPNTPITNTPITNYNKENRIKRFHTLAWPQVKKILIVSDFINRIGWIETYINDVKDILKKEWYEVELFGTKIHKGSRTKIIKHLGFFATVCNFYEAMRIHHKIKKMKPDLIRYHSVLRYMWWMPLRASRLSNVKQRMMYHDLGYFYPFPRKLENEHQIKFPLTLRNFLSCTKTKNPIILLAMIGKFFTLKLIQHQLKKRITTHLVPSPFMKPILHKSFWIPESQIDIFPHFIQE